MTSERSFLFIHRIHSNLMVTRQVANQPAAFCATRVYQIHRSSLICRLLGTRHTLSLWGPPQWKQPRGRPWFTPLAPLSYRFLRPSATVFGRIREVLVLTFYEAKPSRNTPFSRWCVSLLDVVAQSEP